MTTPSTKPVTREMVGAYVRDKGMRVVIATLTGSLLELRPKGNRKVETLDIATLWQQAVKERVAQAKALKKAMKKGRKKP
jgi:hypothetical protein